MYKVQLRSHILSQDVIFVGGGNTKSMLAVWREWGISELLSEAWESGVVLAGVSAGAICWFEQGITDSFADQLTALDCLGFIGGSCCPHYDGEVERRPAYHELLINGDVARGIAIEDGVAVHFIDREISNIVTPRALAKAYHVYVTDGAVKEEPLTVSLLKEPAG